MERTNVQGIHSIKSIKFILSHISSFSMMDKLCEKLLNVLPWKIL